MFYVFNCEGESGRYLLIPQAFKLTRVKAVTKFIEQNSFGILLSKINEEPLATHLPFVVDKDCLMSHFAKANSHWQQLDG